MRSKLCVLELDVEGRKLSLGHKQTKDNPWDKYANEFALDSIHKTAITEIVDKGATIKFNDDVIAFVPQRHMEKEDGSKLTRGEEADFKIVEFNKEFKRVVASHTNIFKDKEKQNFNRAAKKVKETNSEKTHFGRFGRFGRFKGENERQKLIYFTI